jgi:hypothetical protein
VTCIVNHDVKSARISNDLRHAGLDRLAGSNVEFDGPEIDDVLGGIARDLRDLRRVARASTRPSSIRSFGRSH